MGWEEHEEEAALVLYPVKTFLPQACLQQSVYCAAVSASKYEIKVENIARFQSRLQSSLCNNSSV